MDWLIPFGVLKEENNDKEETHIEKKLNLVVTIKINFQYNVYEF
jgi:hypothetical protein